MNELAPGQVATLREMIEAELADLFKLSEGGTGDRAPVQLDQQSFGRVSRADPMRVQAMAVASDKRRTARVAMLRSALERIESGDYGYCAACDELIAPGRLEADPAALLCVSCAGTRGL